MFKITAPFKEKSEVLPLIEAGAQELYCGYLAPEWEAKYTSLEFERKGRHGSNFTDLTQLKQAVDLARSKNIPVYLAINGLYVQQQYPLLLNIIRQLDKIAFSGYIVADLGLMLTLKKQGLARQLHVSTGGTVFNSQAVEFFRKLGACRIVLDRQIKLGDVRSLSARYPKMEFEVFVLNTLCVYIDGFCTFLHSYGAESREDVSAQGRGKDQKLFMITAYDPESEGDACGLRYSVETFDTRLNRKTAKIKPAFYKHLLDGVECGACALYDLAQAKVAAVKIVGRQLSAPLRLRSTIFINACAGILRNQKNINRKDFICAVQQLYRKSFNYPQKCRGNNCYHPRLITQK